MINVGLLGVGNVGIGVIQILSNNQRLILQRTGREIKIAKALVRNISRKRDVNLNEITLTSNPDDVLNDPDIQVIVEAIGGESPAYEYICRAIRNKKHVVTANKEVVAKHKTEIFKLAKENNVDIYYEASVGGGIPLIKALKTGFAANQVNSIYGILNGTTNYILTKIQEEQLTFSAALKKAQELGFAEADPTMDISGLDAAYKLIILAAVAFKADINLKDLYYEGIEDITLKDIIYAQDLGYSIKLLAIGKQYDEGVSFKVHTTMIPKEHPLAGVRNEFNALYIDGDAVGESMLLGKGAGPLPTGSAVVSDLIDLAFDHDNELVTKRNLEDNIQKRKLLPIEKTVSQFYIRLLVPDAYGVLEKITGILGNSKVSISRILQKDLIDNNAELVIVTHETEEENLQKAISKLKSLSEFVKEVNSVIRVGLN